MKKLICIREILSIPVGAVCFIYHNKNRIFISYNNEKGYSIQIDSKFFKTYNINPKSYFKLYDQPSFTKLHLIVMK